MITIKRLNVIRKWISLCLGLITAIAQGQTPIPQNPPCEVLTQTELTGLSGTYFENCIDIQGTMDINAPATVSGLQTLEIVAASDVHIGPNTRIEAPINTFTSNTISVDADKYHLAWFEPENTVGTVEVFEKLELGVRLPQSILDRVNCFVANEGCLDPLNPFDPEDIDIRVVFTYYPNSQVVESQSRFAFYYKEYDRDIVSENVLDWDWVETTDRGYPFRVRFTPDKLGTWIVSGEIKIEGLVEQFLSDFFIDVVPNEQGNGGFVNISSSGYLQDANGSFFPVGRNIVLHSCFEAFNDDPYGCQDIWQSLEYPYNISPLIPTKPSHFLAFLDVVDHFKENGGNTIRHTNYTRHTQLEFVDLGNYSRSLPQAWEMDRIFEKFEEEDLKMDWCLMRADNLKYFDDMNGCMYDWTAPTWCASQQSCCWSHGHFNSDVPYCYANVAGPDIEDYFTNTQSLKYQKNLLRYYISRYGYSTAILNIEFANEINTAGSNGVKVPDITNAPPCANDIIAFDLNVCDVDCNVNDTRQYYDGNPDNFRQAIRTWHDVLSTYIREGLDHPHHLLSANYAGRDHTYVNSVDQSYDLEYIDLPTYNSYEYAQQDELFEVDLYKDNTAQNKPFFHPEIGSIDEADFGGCDVYNTVRHKMLWKMCFSGMISNGLEWLYESAYDSWSIYGKINEFMSQIDLTLPGWEHVRQQRIDGKVDYVALTNLEAEMAWGVLDNRTVNYLSTGNLGTEEAPTPCATKIADGNGQGIPMTASVVTPSGSNPLKIPVSSSITSQDFMVTWSNALTGSHILDITETSSWNSTDQRSEIVLNFPALYAAHPNYLYTFQIQVASEKDAPTEPDPVNLQAESSPESTAVQSNEDSLAEPLLNTGSAQNEGHETFVYSPNVRFYPNPTSGVVNIYFTTPFSGVLTVTDISGIVLRQIALKHSTQHQVSLEKYSSGLYNISINTAEGAVIKTQTIIRL